MFLFRVHVSHPYVAVANMHVRLYWYRVVICLCGLFCRSMERVMVECYGLLSIFVEGYRRKNERYMAMRLPLLDSQMAIKVDPLLVNNSDQLIPPIGVLVMCHPSIHVDQSASILMHDHLPSTNHMTIRGLVKYNTTYHLTNHRITHTFPTNPTPKAIQISAALIV